jgi:hypothetical protein
VEHVCLCARRACVIVQEAVAHLLSGVLAWVEARG